MEPIRNLFASMPEAKQRGFDKRRFSFNAKEGRCPNCDGQGFNLIEMHFLSDVWVKCDHCKGKRYNRETLKIKYRGHNEDFATKDMFDIPFFYGNLKNIESLVQYAMIQIANT